MESDFKQVIKTLKNNVFLCKMQFLVSGIALGVFTWNAVTFIKSIFLADYQFTLYSWVYIFFHPVESTLLNYFFLCIALCIYGVLVYFFLNQKKIKYLENKLATISYGYPLFALILQLISLAVLPSLSLSFRVVLSFVGFLLPFVYFVEFTQRRTLIIFTMLLFVVISLEPLGIVKGPAYLMNEYCDLYGETLIKGNVIDNKQFLNNLRDVDLESVDSLSDVDQKSDLGADKAGTSSQSKIDHLFWEYRTKSLEPLRQYAILRQLNANLATLDVEGIKKFYLANFLEYSHQNMSRGQINHIGQVLNPINEYELGKPLDEVYIQYGLGNTFLMKWTMGLFGGTSVQNYYKCYAYYIVYFVFYLLMLYLLFGGALYTSLGFLFLVFAFYFQGFIAFILAPGILPTIHFFDVIVIILFSCFLKSKRPMYLGAAALFSVASIVLNRQFGTILAAAQCGSFLLYIIENYQGGRKLTWLFLVLLFVLSCAVTFHFAQIGNLDPTFSFFLLGLFSWPANHWIIVLTICYLVVSYSFLFFLKYSRHYLKYVYLLIFIYAQGLLVYYYWSGLPNHLPTVIPFVGLQLVLMAYITETVILLNMNTMRRVFVIMARSGLAVLALATLLSSVHYYKEKLQYGKNFSDHKVYEWKFDRAHVITTINPKLIENSIDLIHKYSNNEKRIYIISKYDNLLPYLSQRYSRMPYFEMSWHLLSVKDTNDAVKIIKNDRAKYLFVDRDIDNDTDDLWAKIFNSGPTDDERASRFGRYRELFHVYKAVSPDYKLIENGSLLAVYERKK